jgi:DNA-binding GntR family transcriptional regulator
VAHSGQTRLLPRTNLGERVYRLLWDRILSRQLHPGEKLSDLRLSAELGVSRTPVREALNRLVQDGIVRTEPHHGFYVQSFSARDINEIYELRGTLEVMALRAAAPRLSTAELKAALSDLDHAESAVRTAETDEGVVEAAACFLEKDQAFHRMIAERANNSRLASVIESLWAQIAVFQKAGTYHREWTLSSISYHRRIITALLDGDQRSAYVEMAAHIDAVKHRVLDNLGAANPPP